MHDGNVDIVYGRKLKHRKIAFKWLDVYGKFHEDLSIDSQLLRGQFYEWIRLQTL
jgi:hypothetical protein